MWPCLKESIPSTDSKRTDSNAKNNRSIFKNNDLTHPAGVHRVNPLSCNSLRACTQLIEPRRLIYEKCFFFLDFDIAAIVKVVDYIVSRNLKLSNWPCII